MLAGAVINSLRHELHETGRYPYGIVSRSAALSADPPTTEIELPPAAEPYRSLTGPGPAGPRTDDPAGAGEGTDDEQITIRSGRGRD